MFLPEIRWNTKLMFVLTEIFTLCAFSAAQSTREVEGFTCQVKNETKHTYAGWPGEIDCNDYIDFLYDRVDYYEVDVDLVETWCLLTDATTGHVLYNQTMDFASPFQVAYTPDLVEGVSLVYYVDIVFPEHSECQSNRITFNVSHPLYNTCQDAQQAMPTTSIPRTLNHIWIGHCSTPRDANPKVFLDERHNVTVEWLYNCSTTFPNNTSVRDVPDSSFDGLSITSVDYQHPGIYTCAVTYKNMTAYAVHYHICVNAPKATGRPAIRCRSSVVAVTTFGANVTLECVANVGTGASSSFTRVIWSKVDSNFECFLFASGPTLNRAEDGYNHQCYRSGTKRICYKEPIAESEVVPEGNELTIRLFLVNVNQSDLGTYTLLVRSPSGIEMNRTVEVVFDDSATDAQQKALAIGLGVGIACFVILILILLLVFRFYVAVFWKTYFGPHGIDDKQFGAYLSYHYSRESDVFAQKTIQDACKSVRSQLKKLGFSAYDEHEDGAPGFRAENAINVMTNCHRVVIILSSEYVKDNWSVFELQQGFKGMIESGSKMIFILVPGMREYINQHSAKDDTYRMIKRAVKINYAISWPCNSLCCGNQLDLEMKMAMPKVQHRTDRNLNGDHPNGIDRFYSNTTAFTDISPDAAESGINGASPQAV